VDLLLLVLLVLLLVVLLLPLVVVVYHGASLVSLAMEADMHIFYKTGC
jgi:hypothetical protein